MGAFYWVRSSKRLLDTSLLECCAVVPIHLPLGRRKAPFKNILVQHPANQVQIEAHFSE